MTMQLLMMTMVMVTIVMMMMQVEQDKADEYIGKQNVDVLLINSIYLTVGLTSSLVLWYRAVT